MARDWIDRKYGIFAAQAQTFTNTLNADPGAYGVSAADAALLAAEYTTYMAAHRLAEDPPTRTKAAVTNREESRDRLAGQIRDIARRIRADRSIADAARIALGMPGGPAERSRAGRPTSRPSVLVGRVVSNLVTLRLRDTEQPALRGKPAHLTGALLFTYAAPPGELHPRPPADPDAWCFAGVTTSGRATIMLRPLPPGSQVFACARWFNTNGMGPLSVPVPTHVTSSFTVHAAA